MKKAIVVLGGVLFLAGVGASCVMFVNGTDVKSKNSNLNIVINSNSDTRKTVASEESIEECSNSEVKVQNFGNVIVESFVSEVSEREMQENEIHDDSFEQGGQEAVDAKVQNFGNVIVESFVSEVSEREMQENEIHDDSFEQGGQEAVDANE